MKISVVLLVLAAGIAPVGLISSSSVTGFKFTTIQVPGFTGSNAYTSGCGINDFTEIVGIAGVAGSTSESFLYTAKTSKFSLVSPTDSYAAINNEREIAGAYGGAGSTLGFLIPKAGSFETLLPPGAATSTASSVNNLGEVLGSDRSQGPSQYFLFRSGAFSAVSVPGYASGLNSSGEIVGTYNPSLSGNVGYLDKNGTVTSIRFPSSTQTYANAINDLGDIVGYFVNSSGASHAFLLHKSVYTEIVVPEETQPGGSEALGINNCGQIVGSYYSADGGTYGFLATPNAPDRSGMTSAQLKSCGYMKP